VNLPCGWQVLTGNSAEGNDNAQSPTQPRVQLPKARALAGLPLPPDERGHPAVITLILERSLLPLGIPTVPNLPLVGAFLREQAKTREQTAPRAQLVEVG
jgi:hypothetical protein